MLSHYGYGCVADYAQTLFRDCTANIRAVHMTYHHNDRSELRCHHITQFHTINEYIFIFFALVKDAGMMLGCFL